MANGAVDITAMTGAGSLRHRVQDATLRSEVGLLARLRAWFAARALASALTSERTSEDEADSTQSAVVSGGRLLLFPIRGEALLVRMADRLRQRVGDARWDEDSRFLTVLRCPHSRLVIDRHTYVEFDPGRATYRAVLDAAPETRLTIETSNFDSVVSFVVQYVDDRLSDGMSLEAVS